MQTIVTEIFRYLFQENNTCENKDLVQKILSEQAGKSKKINVNLTG
jgi:hypothetical protein